LKAYESLIQTKVLQMKKVTSLLLSLFFVLSVSACNTMQGAGEDIEAAGSAIDKKAGEKKNY